nr:MAG TPA: hypothetical protein [Caudoviricetes sp.]
MLLYHCYQFPYTSSRYHPGGYCRRWAVGGEVLRVSKNFKKSKPSRKHLTHTYPQSTINIGGINER